MRIRQTRDSRQCSLERACLRGKREQHADGARVRAVAVRVLRARRNVVRELTGCFPTAAVSRAHTAVVRTAAQDARGRGMGRNPRGGSRFSRCVSSGARSLRSADGFRAIARSPFGYRWCIRQIRDFRQRLRGWACPRGEREGHADVFRALRVCRSVAAGAYGRRATSGNVRWNGLVHAESENNMPTARAFARSPFGCRGRAGMSFAN